MRRNALWFGTIACAVIGVVIMSIGGWQSFVTWSQKTVTKRHADAWHPYQPERATLNEVWITNVATVFKTNYVGVSAAEDIDDMLPGERRRYATSVDGKPFYFWSWQTNAGLVHFGESRIMTLRQMLQKIEESKRL